MQFKNCLVLYFVYSYAAYLIIIRHIPAPEVYLSKIYKLYIYKHQFQCNFIIGKIQIIIDKISWNIEEQVLAYTQTK